MMLEEADAPRIDARSEADIIAEVARNAERLTVDLVLPTRDALIGRTLDRDVPDAHAASVATAGTVIDDALALRIAALPNTGRIAVRGWQQPADGRTDAGMALIRIFGHYAGLLLERLNRVPEKHFLAFLDLIGARPRPPQPARVPLHFDLAPGSLLDALVPAGTQATAPSAAEGDPEPVVFETERPLLVSSARLLGGFVREPDTDRSAIYSAAELAALDLPVPSFAGQVPIEHSLYLARDDFFSIKRSKDATLTFYSVDAARLAALPLVWEFWDAHAQTWQPLASSAALATRVGADWQPVAFDWRLGPADQQNVGRCTITLSSLPPPSPVSIDGLEAGWVRGRLTRPMPPSNDPQPVPIRRRALDPDGLVVGQTPLDGGRPFYPFGQTDPLSKLFYLSSDEAFVRAGASLTLSLDVNATAVGSSDLVLVWRFFDGAAWRELGRSTPSNPSVTSSAWSFADGTRAFTVSGDVTFSVPLIWSSSSLFGRAGRWLRVDLDSGNYGSAGTFRPPFVRRAVVAYSWTPPAIQTITVGVSVQPSDLFAPDLAFVNEMPVDLGKDFYPFGERPRYNDTLFLASQEVFGKPGAAVSMTIVVTNPVGTSTPAPPVPRVAPDQVRIAWEAWDGNVWQQVGMSQPGPNGQSVGVKTFNFADTTLAFSTSGVVSFNAPSWIIPTTVNGESNTWLRARLVQGNYGRDATYVADATGAYHYTAASFAPPLLTSVGIGYRYEPVGPPTACKTYNNFAFVDRSQALASGESFQPLETMLDRRPALYLAFDQHLPNRSTTLYVHATSTQQDIQTASLDRSGASPVTWEYASHGGWVPLGVQDETRALQERGLVTFVGPDDQAQRVEFGVSAYWLRARWETASAAAGPLLRRLLTNTTWASQTQTLRNELVGSSDGGPNQMFRTARAPVLEGETVEVLEDRWLRWDSVADFYASGPRDRHYVMERLSGDIRFGDGQHGMIPPRGRNNVRATLYRTGGGSRGNVAAGSIVQLLTTVPYVASLSNPEAAQAGADAETTQNLQERGPRELRHGGRAVTAIDFEDLALEASPEIARVRALTPSYSHSTLQWLDPSKPNATGDLSAYRAAGAGRVRLIVVPQGHEARPVPSADLIRRVQAHVEQCCAPNLELFVDAPEWVEIAVTAEIVPASLQASDSLRVVVDAAVSRYLHPLYGGPAGSGWAFGQQPAAGDLYPLIESLPAVDHVSSLSLRVSALGDGDPERSLIFSGQHDITLNWPVGGP